MEHLTLLDVREIINLANDYWCRYEEKRIENDAQTDYASPNTLTFDNFLEYGEMQQPLRIRVASLEDKAIKELCALMWLGRGEGNKEDWHSLVQHGDTSPGYIISKTPLVRYLLDGLEKLNLTKDYGVHQQDYVDTKHGGLVLTREINQELYEYLLKNHAAIYELSSQKFEELIADILSNHGFEVQLTKQTRDGGRDIVATYSTPLTRVMTIVECKRYRADRKIGIEQIERFLYVVDRKDDASMGMFVTTSSFTEGAKIIEKQRPYRLALKDISDVRGWLDYHGRTFGTSKSGLWLPK